MLEELRIRGLGVIDDAVLPLGPGLTAVTGETGAGKTMVVTGLRLLFGDRADSGRVRSGAPQATVDGRLVVDPDCAAARRVRDAGGEVEHGELLLRRVVSAAGRSRAHAGGAPVPVGVLVDLADDLLAVHGQADQLRLTRPAEQRAVLDRYAGIDVAPYTAAYDQWRAADAALVERTTRARELQREADLLAHGLAEIDAAAPEPDEDVELAALAGRLAAVDSLRLAARLAHDALLGDPDDPAGAASASDLLAAGRRGLDQAAGADPELDELADRLAGLAAAASDLGAELSAYERGLDADPELLARTEARRAVLTGLTRRYGTDLAEVLAWADQARARLAELDVSDDALARLRAARDQAGEQAARLAEQLSDRRRAAATELAGAVSSELAALAMADARVHVEVRRRAPTADGPRLSVGGEPAGAGPDGVDEVELLLRPRPDAPAVPLGRGASGGELSRVMLAVEVSLPRGDSAPTLVFDEIDAGVGGRAALDVGRRLARLAREQQVVVVTHLAQVAAFADRQVVVRPRGTDEPGGVSQSDVRVVSGPDRVAELARMLSGAQTSTALEHAAELLAGAGHAADQPGPELPAAEQPATEQAAAEQPGSGPTRPARATRRSRASTRSEG